MPLVSKALIVEMALFIVANGAMRLPFPIKSFPVCETYKLAGAVIIASPEMFLITLMPSSLVKTSEGTLIPAEAKPLVNVV